MVTVAMAAVTSALDAILKGSHSPDIVIYFIIGMFQTVMASDSSAYRMKYRKL